MARRGLKISLPFIGRLNSKTSGIVALAGLGVLGLAFLAWSGRQTGVKFIDTAAQGFEDIYEQYVGPLGPGGAPPVSAAPVVPSPAAAIGGTRGMSFDDMVFSGAYATDSPMPYSDWWTTDINEDDRIIIA